MDVDDILIGSGMSALGVALGLDSRRSVLVIGGPARGSSQYYSDARTVPCAHTGYGGLGNFWHGVIPVGRRTTLGDACGEDFATLFERFYPGAGLERHLGGDDVFVPWSAIRPAVVWPRLAAGRPAPLKLIHEMATGFSMGMGGVTVTVGTQQFRGSRLWICAGALQTPALLSRSLGEELARGSVSDHVLCYLGQVDRREHPEVQPARVERTRHGMWLQCWYGAEHVGLYSLRPARFSFRKLDSGIERRAVFGLPMAGAIAKILRGASAGLLAEALYNRTGMFPGASVHSAYAQVDVPDAHWLRGRVDTPLEMRIESIRAATDRARAVTPWPGLRPSRRPDIYLPVIHLHHSVDAGLLPRLGVNLPGGSVQVPDASIYPRLGPEHHTFKLMVAAYARARQFRG